jgi:hypothetical protein
MKPKSIRQNLGQLESLSHDELVARLLGMRDGVTTNLSLVQIREMADSQLRVLILVSAVYRALRRRHAREQRAESPQ